MRNTRSASRTQQVVVIGPGGSGKRTLLRCCNGLEIAQRGTIDICGRRLTADGTMLAENDLNRLRMHVGMVFQSFNLFPHLSVLHNVRIGPPPLRSMSAADCERAAHALLAPRRARARRQYIDRKGRPCPTGCRSPLRSR